MQTNLSSSPERHTFLKKAYLERMNNASQEADPAEIDWYDSWISHDLQKENDPKWQKNNMEYDLRTTPWILEKVRLSDVYAQHLYAAMCNNDFIKNEVFPLLREETWYCSWRHAGGIIANMREKGDYMDWYCSGSLWAPEDNSVEESMVTDEIREDLLLLGWIVRP